MRIIRNMRPTSVNSAPNELPAQNNVVLKPPEYFIMRCLFRSLTKLIVLDRRRGKFLSMASFFFFLVRPLIDYLERTEKFHLVQNDVFALRFFDFNWHEILRFLLIDIWQKAGSVFSVVFEFQNVDVRFSKRYNFRFLLCVKLK